jgi:hypothetical protein
LTEEDFESVRLRLAIDGIEVELMDKSVEEDLLSRAKEFKENWARKEEAALNREGAM